MTSIAFEKILVTPALAKKWLGWNADNQRNIKQVKINQYARDMKSGAWHSDSGETIKFSPGETHPILIDGQNRLHAVIKADTAILFYVVWGVNRDVMKVLDTGASRTFADVIRIDSTPGYANNIGAIVRWDLAWKDGMYTGRSGKAAYTHSELIEHLQTDPVLFAEAARRGRDIVRERLAVASSAGIAYVLFHRINPEMNLAFFDHFITGANLPNHHPILAIRNHLISNRNAISRYRSPEQLAVIIRGWNAYRRDKQLKNVVMISQGARLTNDNFPKPI